MKTIDIYTDGSCSGNPGPGGWGAMLMYKGNAKYICGYELSTTNNRMEILSVIKALQMLREACEINLYSDSAYVIDALTKGWLQNWIKNGWKLKDKKPVKNQDLWEELLQVSNGHIIHWHKVRGHADNQYNNLCDQMAQHSTQEAIKYLNKTGRNNQSDTV